MRSENMRTSSICGKIDDACNQNSGEKVNGDEPALASISPCDKLILPYFRRCR